MAERSGPTTMNSSTVALGLAQIRVGKAAPYIALNTCVLTAAQSMGAMAKTAFVGDVKYWKMESGFPLMEDFAIPTSEGAKLDCEFREISSKNLAIARGLDVFADVAASVIIGSNSSALGGTTGSITVTNAGGVINENWHVVFLTATSGTIYGEKTGAVHDFANLTTIMAPDNSGNPYFSIPANFFSGTYAADDMFSFTTTAFVAGTSAYSDAHGGEIKLGTMVAPAFVRMEAVYTYPNGINHMYIIFPRANVVSSVDLKLEAADSANVPITFEAKQSHATVDGGHAVWNSAPLGRVYFD